MQTVLRLVLVLALIFQNFLVLEQVEVSEVVTERHRVGRRAR